VEFESDNKNGNPGADAQMPSLNKRSLILLSCSHAKRGGGQSFRFGVSPLLLLVGR
jgi:hypothetical protein